MTSVHFSFKKSGFRSFIKMNLKANVLTMSVRKIILHTLFSISELTTLLLYNYSKATFFILYVSLAYGLLGISTWSETIVGETGLMYSKLFFYRSLSLHLVSFFHA